jgi:hypothetical protein
MSTSFKLYAHPLPERKSYVNFEFTERQEHSLICRLIDYDLSASMPFQYLTRKKRIKSLNKMTPLNKPMIGTIEEINDDDIIISIAYIEPESESYLKFKEETMNNNFLRRLFVRYSRKNGIDEDELWKEYIYPLDIKRLEESDQYLYEYIFKNYQDLEMNPELKSFLAEQFLSKEKDSLDKTNFKMVSVCGVYPMKQLLEKTLTEMNINCDIFLDNCPNFVISSRDSKTKKEDHKLFLTKVDEELKSNELQIYLSY